MPRIVSDGAEISYDDFGQGEPALLFMPGWCSNRTVFGPLLSRLEVNCRSLVLDWRGHGESGAPKGDFGTRELLGDALAVIKASGAREIVPVALSHAGWLAVELRRQLATRIPAMVLLDWIVSEAPSSFVEILHGLQSSEHWRETVNQVFEIWLHGVQNLELDRLIRGEMGHYGFEMWARAAHEIEASYTKEKSPLEALSSLHPAPPTLHLYAQPADPGYLAMQQSFAATHPWFHVQKLDAKSHFPMVEVPDQAAAVIREFIAD